MKNFKNNNLQNFSKAMDHYFDEIRKFPGKACELRQNYTGEELVRRLQELNNDAITLKYQTQTIVNSSISAIIEAIDSKRRKAIDSSKISPDYELLSLPVKLSKDELEMLAVKNSDDILFQRALSEYAQKNEIKEYTPRVFDIQRKEEAIENMKSIFNAATLGEDASQLASNAEKNSLKFYINITTGVFDSLDNLQ